MTKGSILVVEDEIIIAEDLAGKLRQIGYEVAHICRSGEEAVEKAERLRPDLVLMDIHLEGRLDGVDAAETIRQRFDLPTIFLTAHADAATFGRAKLTQPFGYILKPFNEQVLSIQLELALFKHRAERELRNQREWLRVTLNSIADAVLATDTDGRVTFLNPLAASLLGWEAAEAEGKLASEVVHLIHEQTGEELADPVAQVLGERRGVALSNHAALLTRDGQRVPVEDSAAPILDGAGQVIGVVAVFRDVSERRRAAEALSESLRRLKATQDELVRKERLAVLGQLAGGVAHELRTPLNIIQNSIYFLQQTSSQQDGTTSEVFEEAGRAITSCDHIIGEMLDYVREPSRQTSVFPISDAIERALRLVPRTGTIRLARSGNADGALVNANQDQIIRILANLILNSVQSMPDGGQLEIAVDAMNGCKVSIEIRDTGCGIPEENLAKVFDPLFTTKARGIGLGLAVCQRYARLNLAELSASSVAGEGSTFRLVLDTTQAG